MRYPEYRIFRDKTTQHIAASADAELEKQLLPSVVTCDDVERRGRHNDFCPLAAGDSHTIHQPSIAQTTVSIAISGGNGKGNEIKNEIK